MTVRLLSTALWYVQSISSWPFFGGRFHVVKRSVPCTTLLEDMRYCTMKQVCAVRGEVSARVNDDSIVGLIGAHCIGKRFAIPVALVGLPNVAVGRTHETCSSRIIVMLP